MSGLGGLSGNASYRVYFDHSDSAMQQQNQFEVEFNRSDTLLLILTPPSSSPAQNMLRQGNQYRQLGEQLLSLPQISAARGLNEWSDTDLPEIRKPVEDAYLARSKQSGLIELDVQLVDAASARELVALERSIRAITDQWLAADYSVVFGGPLALNLAYSDVIKHDLRVFIPGLLLLTGLALFIALGHLWLSVGLLLLGGLAIGVAAGVAGWLRFELAAINAFAPVVITGLSLATHMHLVLACVRRLGHEKQDNKPNEKQVAGAVRQGINDCRWPFTISCLTTAAGFAALASSPSPPVQKLGLMVAIGVVAIYLLGRIVLPLLLIRINLATVAIRYAMYQQQLESLASVLCRNRQWITAVFLVVLMATAVPLSQLKIDDSVYGYFPQDHSFSHSIETLDQDFSGSVQLHYKLDSGAAMGVFEPAQLTDVTHWIDWLRQQPEVTRVSNLAEQLHQPGVPTTAMVQAIESSMLRRLVNADYSAQVVTVQMKSAPASALLEFDKRVTDQLATYTNIPAYTGGLGADLVFAKLGQRNARSMFATLALALLVITVVLGLFFKSRKLCLIGLICNATPLVVVYGLWVLAGGYISLGCAVVMGMIMGIIVDDTVHLLYRFHDQKTLQGRLADQPQTESFRVTRMLADTGPALLISSIALIAGLAIGLLSDFRPIRELALLSMAVIFIATLTDLLLLPALLGFNRRKPQP